MHTAPIELRETRKDGRAYYVVSIAGEGQPKDLLGRYSPELALSDGAAYVARSRCLDPVTGLWRCRTTDDIRAFRDECQARVTTGIARDGDLVAVDLCTEALDVSPIPIHSWGALMMLMARAGR